MRRGSIWRGRQRLRAFGSLDAVHDPVVEVGDPLGHLAAQADVLQAEAEGVGALRAARRTAHGPPVLCCMERARRMLRCNMDLWHPRSVEAQVAKVVAFSYRLNAPSMLFAPVACPRSGRPSSSSVVRSNE